MVEKPLQRGLRAVHHFWYYRPGGQFLTVRNLRTFAKLRIFLKSNSWLFVLLRIRKIRFVFLRAEL
jgi:hypothetical protein